jgi:hypothetical protein
MQTSSTEGSAVITELRTLLQLEIERYRRQTLTLCASLVAPSR